MTFPEFAQCGEYLWMVHPELPPIRICKSGETFEVKLMTAQPPTTMKLNRICLNGIWINKELEANEKP